jgi:hypothetical protein
MSTQKDDNSFIDQPINAEKNINIIYPLPPNIDDLVFEDIFKYMPKNYYPPLSLDVRL